MDPPESITLRQYIDIQITQIRADLEILVQNQRALADAHAISHAREHQMTQTAVNMAADSLSKRLEGMNEFRAALSDQAATMARRDVVDVQIAAIMEKIEKVMTAETMTRALSGDQAIVARKELSDRITKLETKAANQDGRLWAMGVGISIALTILALAFKVFETVGK